MARIELITSKSQIEADRHAEYDEIMNVLGHVGGPFGVLMYSPGLAERICKAGAHVRLQSELTLAEREIALLSVCREKDAAYEWSVHAPTARKAGVSDETIAVIRDDADPGSLPTDDEYIIRYTRELLRTNRVSDEVFEKLRSAHGTRWLVELTATIGQYQYISAINNAFGNEPSPGGEELPIQPRRM